MKSQHIFSNKSSRSRHFGYSIPEYITMTGIQIQVVACLAVLLAVSSSPIDVPVGAGCTVTAFKDVAAATASCSSLIIKDLNVPAGQQLVLNLKSGASLTFQGTIKFGVQHWEGPLIVVTGSGVHVTGAPGSVFDGQGGQYWDGQGDHGVKKPKFIRIKTSGRSTFKNIHLLNCPKQCVSINSASDTTLSGWVIDSAAGDKNGGKNTDGFDVSSSTGITVEHAVVKNQDDCVAVNQGSNFIFNNLTCSGGHGLSLSVGQSDKSGAPNTVRNVTFSNSRVLNSRNGIHVKTHTDAGTGSVSHVTYLNIQMSGITHYAINVQEDYSNGKSTKVPRNNIPITGLTLNRVTGSMSGASNGMAVYILCARGGCSNWNWSGVSIGNAKKPNECTNFTPNGFKCK